MLGQTVTINKPSDVVPASGYPKQLTSVSTLCDKWVYKTGNQVINPITNASSLQPDDEVRFLLLWR